MKAQINSIFIRLVLALLIAVAPLYGLGLLMNRLGENSVRDEWIQSMNSKNLFYMHTLESELGHIENLLVEYMNNKDLSHLSVLSDIMTKYEWTEAANRVEYELHLIQSSSHYVKRANAFLLTIGRTIPDNRSILDTITEEYGAIRSRSADAEGHFLIWDGRWFMGRSFPENSPEPVYALSVEIDALELMKTLQNLAESGGGAALISRSGEWILTDKGEPDEAAASALRQFIQDRYQRNQTSGNVRIALNGRDQRISFLYSPAMDAYLSLYIPQDIVTGQTSFYRDMLWLLSFISFMVIVGYSYSIFRTIHRPLQKMIRAYRRVRDGELAPVPLPEGNNEFHYLFRDFNEMIERLGVLIHDNYEQAIRAKHAQIKQLQSQINPHFLYNTYYILYRLSQAGDMENVSRFTRYLGQYFEFITRHADDTVSLEVEIRHTQSYIEIQQFRFSGRLSVEPIALPDACRNVIVPKLILQPIVENAFKYALERKKRDGRLRIAIDPQEDWVKIVVEDNGEGLADEEIARMNAMLEDGGEETESTGIVNVHRRLQLICGTDSGIVLARSDLGGLQATLRVTIQRGG